jgi:pyruvate dehydrogenase E1 component beta subunit
MAAEIIAKINERELLSLEAPIARVTGYDTVMPLPKMENYYLPNGDRIRDAIEKTMSF